ncbi:MAG TPA: response regulator [Fimbriimonas sp.]|nr:response regulator [Fimbriimonas sp.]
MVEATRLLVIDDELPIRRFLRASLDKERFELLEAETGEQGVMLTARRNPAVVLLDLGLPDMDGVVVTKTIREWSKVPIIVLSARGREQDKIDALDAGADDYLTKPFGIGELLARIRVALRHSGGAETLEPTVETAAFKVDVASRLVTRNGEEVHLTPNEYKLLAILVRHAGRVVTHKHLLQEVWGPGYEAETHYLRVYMGQLRQKLEDNPTQPLFLINEPGVGYRLKTD